nr:thioesterase family protein [uncultured Blautia sp.]
MKEESEKIYTYYRRAQYHETDQMGIIHHSNYVKWMEEARIGYMDQMGFTYKKVEEMGVISPVVEISVTYKKQVFFDDDIQIRVSIRKYNGISLEFNYEFFNTTRNEICTVAYSRHCFLKDGKLISVKKELPDLDCIITTFV